MGPKVPIEVEINRLRGLQRQGNHNKVLHDLRLLIADLPQDRNLLLMEAVSLRNLGSVAEAMAALDRLQNLQPQYAPLHQERGNCFAAFGDKRGAIDAFRKAVGLNPALSASWSMLERLYRAGGDVRNAEVARTHVATLASLPAEVVHATSLFFDGELNTAEAVIRDFLARRGRHPEAMRLLANIGAARDALDDAEQLYKAVLELAPKHHAARYEYAATLTKQNKYAEAQEELKQLLSLDPRNVNYRLLAAAIALGLGNAERAICIYNDLLLQFPKAHDIHLWMGHALKTAGDLPKAIEHYRKAAALRPDFGEAYWSLANLKNYRFSDEEIARMRAGEASSRISWVDHCHLCFAMGKAQEDRAVFAESWRYYERGNALKRSQIHYDPEVIENNTRSQIAVCTKEFFEERKNWGDLRPDPIFIVGLPRSGSTLIEQILASHSQVEGTQELFAIQRIVRDMGRRPDRDEPRYPAILSQMSADDFRLLGEKFIEGTRMFRSGKPFFIDKMPNNFRDIGLMHLMLPNAKIIDVRREPVACCFSNLKQLFATGQEFTYSVEDTSRYYRTYLDLMRHWNEVLPERILRVHYEDVVDDLEGSVRKILKYCNLPFEQSCIDFYKTKRSVFTPSSEQVRAPVFRESVDQWKKYELWLGPLKYALGDAVTRYRD